MASLVELLEFSRSRLEVFDEEALTVAQVEGLEETDALTLLQMAAIDADWDQMIGNSSRSASDLA
jgi:hypothetical protein